MRKIILGLIFFSSSAFAGFVSSTTSPFYRIQEECELKENSQCYEVSADADRTVMSIANGSLVIDQQKLSDKIASDSAAASAVQVERNKIDLIKAKLKSNSRLTDAELDQTLIFILKKMGETP